MEKINDCDLKEQLLTAYNEGTEAEKRLFEKTFGNEMFKPKDVTKRIKTFDDACDEADHRLVADYRVQEMKEFWLAREKNGSLWMFFDSKEPVCYNNETFINGARVGNPLRLPNDMFPEVIWENSPKKVKLVIDNEQ